MKKFLAVLMSLVMMFSLAAPAMAAEEEAKDEITLQEVIDTVVLTVELIQDTLIQVHSIVGSILGLLEKECPMCGEIHVYVAEDEEAGDVEDAETEETLPEEEILPAA